MDKSFSDIESDIASLVSKAETPAERLNALKIKLKYEKRRAKLHKKKRRLDMLAEQLKFEKWVTDKMNERDLKRLQTHQRIEKRATNLRKLQHDERIRANSRKRQNRAFVDADGDVVWVKQEDLR